MKKIIVPLFLTALACQPEQDSQSQTHDIVGPGRVKTLIRNIPFSESFEKTLVGFGYQLGSSCIQEVKETARNGQEKTYIKLFSKPCANYPISGTAVTEIKLLDSFQSGGLTLLVSQGKVIAELSPQGFVDNLCFKKYAVNCDLSLGFEDGSIESITIKNSSSHPINRVPENSLLAKGTLYLANKANAEQLKLAGLTLQEITTVKDHRRVIGKFTSIRSFAGYSNQLANVPVKLARMARFLELEEYVKDISDQWTNVRFINSCNKNITVAIRYLNSDWEWVISYGHKFRKPKDGEKHLAILSTSDRKKIKNYGKHFYYYAETTEGSPFYWKGNHRYKIKGDFYGFKKATSTNRNFDLECR